MQASVDGPRPTILVTGISGTLGRRLLPLLSAFRVIGVDLAPLDGHPEVEIHPLHLGHEASCVELVRLMREKQVDMVVHLAFVVDPVRAGLLDRGLMWQSNVAGTARVMEAISEVNRQGGHIRKFLYPGSAMVYGPETAPLVAEDAPHNAHTLTYALQQAETDHVVRFRAPGMNHCATYLLRIVPFAGAEVESVMLRALRGLAYGNGAKAARWREKGRRIPLVLPMGRDILEKPMQFVHVDDVARLLRWLIVRRDDPADEPVVLNVAAPGDPLSRSRCLEVAGALVCRRITCGLCLRRMESDWKSGLSAVPPQAFPYLSGSWTVNINRLRALLGSDFPRVMQFGNEEALLDSFRPAGAETEMPAEAGTTSILSLR